MEFSKVSIVTPVFNSMRTLELYMTAILEQNYPHSNIEIIFADGGSTDGTVEKIKEYQNSCDIKIKLFNNPLKTAEAGKAVGVLQAENEIICLLDSDNILPSSDWLNKMMIPFKDNLIIASEPIEYTYRKNDSVINRYCALIGMNDPLCIFTGNYDRTCLITGKWTEVLREEEDFGEYLSIKFNPKMIPTIGANGFCMRKDMLLENFEGDYLFDIDILWEVLQKNPEIRIAKVKIGIVHLFCPNIKTFYRKQNRRIQDFLYFNSNGGGYTRKYPWNKVGKSKIVLFALCCITIIPLLIQSVIGFSKKQDFSVWAFHLLACWITLWVYGIGTIKSIFYKAPANRANWKQ